jgi:hypothetical protein
MLRKSVSGFAQQYVQNQRNLSRLIMPVQRFGHALHQKWGWHRINVIPEAVMNRLQVNSWKHHLHPRIYCGDTRLATLKKFLRRNRKCPKPVTRVKLSLYCIEQRLNQYQVHNSLQALKSKKAWTVDPCLLLFLSPRHP